MFSIDSLQDGHPADFWNILSGMLGVNHVTFASFSHHFYFLLVFIHNQWKFLAQATLVWAGWHSSVFESFLLFHLERVKYTHRWSSELVWWRRNSTQCVGSCPLMSPPSGSWGSLHLQNIHTDMIFLNLLIFVFLHFTHCTRGGIYDAASH